MDRPAATLVPGVERGQQVDDLGPPHLPHDEAVGTHAQGLPDEVLQGHGARSLDVGRAGLEAHDVRVDRRQLAGVLDEQDPVAGIDQAEQGGQQGGLARPGAPAHDEGHLGGHQPSEQLGAVRWD